MQQQHLKCLWTKDGEGVEESDEGRADDVVYTELRKGLMWTNGVGMVMGVGKVRPNGQLLCWTC